MYWFVIFYYENTPEQYVIPVKTKDGYQLKVYASTPQQASEAALEVINSDDRYDHHIPRIGTLSSAVHANDVKRWHQDHNPAY